ncbi:MAG: hypothetical protein WC426_13525 [Sulfuriferula sp.]
MNDWLKQDEMVELVNKLENIRAVDRQDELAKLNDTQINQIFYHLQYRKGTIQTLLDRAAEVRLDRRNDFEKMAKQATKRFDDLDIEILHMLDYEMAWYARGILSHVNEDGERYTIEDVRKSIKKLKRRGLVELVRGLVDESDGFLAGSGWQLCYRNQKHIDKILAVFEAHENQQELGV